MWCYISIAILAIFLFSYLKKRKKLNNVFLRQKFKDIRNGKYLSVDDRYHEKIFNQKSELDRILDKISNKGLSSLNKNEKDFLDKISRK